MVQQRRDDARPVRANREARSVLPLARAVDRERGHSATEELVLDRVELFLYGVQSGHQDHERWPRGVGRDPQDARDARPFERRLDP